MMCLLSITDNDRNGVFLPKGAAYLLGLEMYATVLKANEFFLTMVATIPVNLEFDTWFTVINLQPVSDNFPLQSSAMTIVVLAHRICHTKKMPHCNYTQQLKQSLHLDQHEP